ncbi:helix-turn-helix transcriptional regulator [Salisaeta longa]|uniref:helix-turn-helix transcriptional regulator n=1 Tax=Salisaeta longa TaxID=503170 RepID=UPI0003B35C93|nr:WYL domain-containing protein [Salisaeta longa]
MPLAERSIDQLHNWLNAGHEFTLDDISERLEVSRRHARRLLSTLDDMGYTVKERREGRSKYFSYASSARSMTTKVDLQERELQALIIAAYAARPSLRNTPFLADLQHAIEQLVEAAGPVYSFEPEFQNDLWHFDSSNASTFDPDIWATVVQAANERNTLAIDYYSASSRTLSEGRRIDPLVVAEQGQTWMVTAYCHKHQAVRDFALAGIRAAAPTGASFMPPRDFDPETHFADRFHALKGEGTHRVELTVAADKAPYFHRKQYHPSQQIAQDTTEEPATVTFEVSSLDDIAAFIRSWGPGITVEAPAALAARLKSEAAAMHAAYSDAS